MLVRNFILWSLVLSASYCGAGTKVTVGHSVPESRQVAMDRIDHATWNELLQTFVDSKGQVNYKGWKASSPSVTKLDEYLAALSTASLKKPATKPAQLAYWINAYNAMTVKGILREYPTTSIRNHTAKLYGYNIWKDLLLQVGGRGVSLTQIEHDVLRKLEEPRIHFAIVCASRGCPRLLNQAYEASTLEAQLSGNTKAFFADPQNFRYDVNKQTFFLSAILDWYPDFGGNQSDQLNTIGPYLPTPESRRAASSGRLRVSYLKYDWDLNEQK